MVDLFRGGISEKESLKKREIPPSSINLVSHFSPTESWSGMSLILGAIPGGEA